MLNNIHHVIIRKLYQNYHAIFLDLYNCLLHLNYFYNDWKPDELVHFLKPDKPPDEMGSHKPISLLLILGKTFKKLLKRNHYFLWPLLDIQPSQHVSQQNQLCTNCTLKSNSILKMLAIPFLFL